MFIYPLRSHKTSIFIFICFHLNKKKTCKLPPISHKIFLLTINLEIESEIRGKKINKVKFPPPLHQKVEEKVSFLLGPEFRSYFENFYDLFSLHCNNNLLMKSDWEVGKEMKGFFLPCLFFEDPWKRLFFTMCRARRRKADICWT